MTAAVVMAAEAEAVVEADDDDDAAAAVKLAALLLDFSPLSLLSLSAAFFEVESLEEDSLDVPASADAFVAPAPASLFLTSPAAILSGEAMTQTETAVTNGHFDVVVCQMNSGRW